MKVLENENYFTFEKISFFVAYVRVTVDKDKEPNLEIMKSNNPNAPTSTFVDKFGDFPVIPDVEGEKRMKRLHETQYTQRSHPNFLFYLNETPSKPQGKL